MLKLIRARVGISSLALGMRARTFSNEETVPVEIYGDKKKSYGSIKSGIPNIICLTVTSVGQDMPQRTIMAATTSECYRIMIIWNFRDEYTEVIEKKVNRQVEPSKPSLENVTVNDVSRGLWRSTEYLWKFGDLCESVPRPRQD